MTKKPRITITLEPHQRDVLGRIAKANRVPMARIVSDVVGAVTPYLERVVVLLEQAAKLKGKTIAAPLVHALGRAEGRALQLSEDVLGQIDLFIAGTQSSAGAAPVADAQRPAPAAPTPVPCNHGGQVVRKGPPPTAKTASGGRPEAVGKGRKGPRSATQSARLKVKARRRRR